MTSPKYQSNKGAGKSVAAFMLVVIASFAFGRLLVLAQEWNSPLNAPPELNAGQPPDFGTLTDVLLKSPQGTQVLQGPLTGAVISNVAAELANPSGLDAIAIIAKNSFTIPTSYPIGNVGIYGYAAETNYGIFSSASGAIQNYALYGKAESAGVLAALFHGPVRIDDNASALGTLEADGSILASEGLHCLEDSGCRVPNTSLDGITATHASGGIGLDVIPFDTAAVGISVTAGDGIFDVNDYPVLGFSILGDGIVGHRIYGTAFGNDANTYTGVYGWASASPGTTLQQRKGVYGVSQAGLGNAESYSGSPNHDLPAGVRACVKDANTGAILNQHGIKGDNEFDPFAGYFFGSSQCAPSAPIVIDTAQRTGIESEMIIASDGKPIIVYYNDSDGDADLYIAKCSLPDCSDTSPSGNIITPLDTSIGDVGWVPNIAIPSDDLPVISYYDDANLNLKFVKCGSPACNSGNIVRTIASDSSDASGGDGRWNDIAIGTDIPTGFPVISFFGGNKLRVAKCGDASCDPANTVVVTITTGGEKGSRNAITISPDGYPVIAYEASGLRVVKCNSHACDGVGGGPNDDSPVDTGIDIFLPMNIEISPADNFPIILYDDFTGGLGATDLKVAKCKSEACDGSGGTPIDISAIYSTLWDITRIDMAIPADNLPVITTKQTDAVEADRLEVRKCDNVNCTSATLEPRRDIPGVSYTSVAISPSDGFPIIAFSNVDSVDKDLNILKCFDAKCTETAEMCTITGGPTLIASGELNIDGTALSAPQLKALLCKGLSLYC